MPGDLDRRARCVEHYALLKSLCVELLPFQTAQGGGGGGGGGASRDSRLGLCQVIVYRPDVITQGSLTWRSRSDYLLTSTPPCRPARQQRFVPRRLALQII